MSKYVKNADLSVEYILKRAINAGLSVAQSLDREYYLIGEYLMPTKLFEANLVSFRRCVENTIYYKRIGA